MSEGTQAERTPSIEDVPDIAAKYLDASEEEPEHQERLQAIEAELDELESAREEVAGDMGEEHYLVEEIDSDIQDLKDEREELQKSTEDVARLREDILRAAAEKPGFRLDEHWLNSKPLQALTHALYGNEEERLVIRDHELQTPDDAQELDRMQRIQIKKDVVYIARDQIEQDERVSDHWEQFESSTAHQAFSVIAREPGVGPSEIAEAYDDTSPSTVRNWTSNLSDQEDLKMVYNPKTGSYYPSTVGKYYATHYATLDGNEDSDKSEDGTEIEGGEKSVDQSVEAADEEDEEDSEQVGLGNSDEAPVDQPKGPTDSKQRATVSEAETTEEKADALFNAVSETRRTNE